MGKENLLRLTLLSAVDIYSKMKQEHPNRVPACNSF